MSEGGNKSGDGMASGEAQQSLPFDFPDDKKDMKDDGVVDAVEKEGERKEEKKEEAKGDPKSAETAEKEDAVKSAEKKGEAPARLTSDMRSKASKGKPAAAGEASGGGKSAESAENASPSTGAKGGGEGKKASIPATGLHRLEGSKGKKKRPRSDKTQGSFLPGQFLRNAREDAEMTIAQAHMSTRIKEGFIRALESGDFEALPSPVFAEAYIKRLCALYEIDSEEPVKLFRQHCKETGSAHLVPGEILEDIEKGMQVNLEEERRVRVMVKNVVIGAAVLAVVALLAVKFLAPSSASKNGGGSAASKPADVSGGPAAAPSSGPAFSETSSEASSASTASEPKPAAPASVSSESLEVFLTDEPFNMTEMDIPEDGGK